MLSLFLYNIKQVYDILVVNQNYNGDGTTGALALQRGDLVEVLQTVQPHANGTANDDSKK